MAGRAIVAEVGALVLAALVSVGCGSSGGPPATLTIDVRGDTDVVRKAAGFMEDCYLDGSAPETCTSGTLPGLYALCGDLVGSTDLEAADVVGAVTVYPADNARIGEMSCLFTNPRSNLSIELWRDPPASLCGAEGSVGEGCIDVGESLEAGRRSDLPLISVAGRSGAVVSSVASATLDDRQLVAAAAVLASEVFDQDLTPASLAGLQAPSTKPE